MTCKYCDGKGHYITYTFGMEEKHRCQFCAGTGEVKG